MQFDRDIITLLIAIAGVCFGFLGAALGVINTWRAFDRDRIRIRVEPRFFFRTNGVETAEGYSIIVTNLSYIPVTITSVGFTMRGSKDRLDFFAPLDCTFPQRMEARTRLTASILEGNNSKFWRVRRVYAETACGKTFTGSCRWFLRELKRRAATQRRAQPRQEQG